MVDRYDVVVAGGGPAGLIAAKTAAAQGGKVLLLELQAQIGGQIQSANWAPSELLTPNLKDAVVSDVKEVRFHSSRHRLIARGNFGSIIDRGVFDKLLANEAIAGGAEIIVGCPVKELLIGGEAVRGVRIEAGGWREDIECEVVIDATGARGEWSGLMLKKAMGMDWNAEKLIVSNEYLMANAEDDQAVDIFFNSYFSPQGNAWIYPLGRSLALAGIRGVRIHPDIALDEFMGRMKIPRLEKASPIAAYRAQLPFRSDPVTYGNGIIAVGSSAGQVYPLSGHGLKYAMECGEIAGRVAVDAITEGDVTKKGLEEYERRWRSKFGVELKIGQLLCEGLKISPDKKINLLFDLADELKLQDAIVKIFTGAELKPSISKLFEHAGVRKIFGREIYEKIIAMCE
ncbi:MAG: hypothetical protein APU95_06020 [Hadesarchaea archaeon YNP_N21]|nr:MAG: hypothetical protein APU95_06020 [Hadesarchaea archaeon YNP_N21]